MTRTMQHHLSPISFLFFGKYRSVIKRPRSKDSVTMEPFHCVSLEINDPTIHTLSDALDLMSRSEHIDGAAITKTITIDTAPPILIVHLKRFYYHPTFGVEKLAKFILYPQHLDLCTTRLSHQYQLCAVIYHHGRTADGGHYTCHVRNTTDTWIYFDDASLTEHSLGSVLADKGPVQTAYLLFYIRCDAST